MKDFEKVQQLRNRFQNGEGLSFHFFWKGPFSQWDRQGFSVDGVLYKTAEHWMMSEKARLFGDEDSRKNIIAASSPKLAKDLGREVKNFDEGIWAQHRYEIVLSGNRYKFQRGMHRDRLLATGDKILVEASPYDGVWGIKMGESDPDINNPIKWKGLNLLGFVLTELREEIKNARVIG